MCLTLICLGLLTRGYDVPNPSNKSGSDLYDNSPPFLTVSCLASVTFRYFVPNPSYKSGSDMPERLELLKGITGYAEPGQLTALMGGSGAGKTTLMVREGWGAGHVHGEGGLGARSRDLPLVGERGLGWVGSIERLDHRLSFQLSYLPSFPPPRTALLAARPLVKLRETSCSTATPRAKPPVLV